MYKRELLFITEVSNELAMADPLCLPQVCVAIMTKHKAHFIAVKDPKQKMSTVFVGYYNTDVKTDAGLDRFLFVAQGI